MNPPTYDSDDDEDIGPKPLAAGHSEQPDPIKEFMEKEDKRKKAAEVRTLFHVQSHGAKILRKRPNLRL